MIKTFGKFNVMLKEEEHTANYIFREMKVWKNVNVRLSILQLTLRSGYFVSQSEEKPMKFFSKKLFCVSSLRPRLHETSAMSNWDENRM